jgi:hypothetical protein
MRVHVAHGLIGSSHVRSDSIQLIMQRVGVLYSTFLTSQQVYKIAIHLISRQSPLISYPYRINHILHLSFTTYVEI